MRKIISILLAIVLILSMTVSAFAENEKETAAAELNEYGIILKNYLGGFTVEGTVTRAEMATVLQRFLSK